MIRWSPRLRSSLVIGSIIVVASLPPRSSDSIADRQVGVAPDRVQCITPSCLTVSPAGWMPVPVTVVDEDGNAIVGAAVTLSFNCPSLWACAGEAVYAGATDASGSITFLPKIGGCCAQPGAATIMANGVVIAEYPVVNSPDIDGNSEVALADFVRFQISFLSGACCSDLFGCDGFVGLSDFTIFQAAFLDTCPDPMVIRVLDEDVGR